MAIDSRKFGMLLVQLRKEQGMTQKELAEKLHVSDKAVSKWERGLSLPDIALLQPMGELLGVGVSELLSGQRIQEDQQVTMKAMEPLPNGELTMTAQEWEAQRANRRKWGKRFAAVLAACAAELIFIWWKGLAGDDLASMLLLPPVMAGGFGVYFIFFAKEKVPAFYDQYRINFFSDGFFRMNVPGVYFNNRNWLHILNGLRAWSCLTLGGWAAVYAGIRWILTSPQIPENIVLGVLLPLTLFVVLGGLFIPVYVIGKKYE